MSDPALNIIFAGTPDFAAEALRALINSRHNVIAVYSQPDRPAGRGRKLTASPVKQLALEHAIPVEQPENFKDQESIATLASYKADLMVVAAYGLLLPVAVLETPRLGCLNIHASLLPRWRGAAPIQRAIAAGDTETGITIMQMDKGLDTGDMLLKLPCPISKYDTGGSLHDTLAEIGAQAIVEALDNLSSLKPQKQDDNEVTYAHKLTKAEAQLDWQRRADELERQVRAFNPWPVSYFMLEDKAYRCWQAESRKESPGKPAGTILSIDKDGLKIACNDGSLLLTSIQPPGKKAMSMQDFLNGHASAFTVGYKLG